LFVNLNDMSVKEFKALNYTGGKLTEVNDPVIVEGPLQILVNGDAFSITMRTPGNDKELTRGLLFTEDVLHINQIPFKYMVADIDSEGFVLASNVLIEKSNLGKGIEKQRSLTSVSSCGICGQQNLDDIAFGGDAIQAEVKLDMSLLEGMFESMRSEQTDFDKTGGCHASAAFTSEGKLLAVYEDIGRHNAVDKVIGSLLLDQKISKAFCILVSGRVSYEIISKCYKAGIPFLASVSAPSNMAVEMAQDLGICLLAFCRGDSATAYSNLQMLAE
jgi:FdhD protein